MSFLAPFIIFFAFLGAIDYVIGDKIGIGKEFKKAFELLGTMSLSMIGMIVIAPLIGSLLSPLFEFTYKTLHVDPSIISASLLANIDARTLNLLTSHRQGVAPRCSCIVSRRYSVLR